MMNKAGAVGLVEHWTCDLWVVLLQFKKSCLRSVSAGFVKKIHGFGFGFGS